jgi:hypothetical protein
MREPIKIERQGTGKNSLFRRARQQLVFLDIRFP